MSLSRQILVVILCYLLSFLFIRGFLWGVKGYLVNKSSRKKRKKGETLKDWFLYSRYRTEIPKILIILYFVIVGIHPFVILCCIGCYILNLSQEVGTILAKATFWFDLSWFLAIQLLFWQAKPEFKYERWINKKGGNRKK